MTGSDEVEMCKRHASCRQKNTWPTSSGVRRECLCTNVPSRSGKRWNSAMRGLEDNAQVPDQRHSSAVLKIFQTEVRRRVLLRLDQIGRGLQQFPRQVLRTRPMSSRLEETSTLRAPIELEKKESWDISMRCGGVRRFSMTTHQTTS